MGRRHGSVGVNEKKTKEWGVSRIKIYTYEDIMKPNIHC